MQRRFLFGVMGLVLGVLALSARAQSGSTSISHVTATVAKADLHGSWVQELSAPAGQRRLRIHLHNGGNYGAGATVVTIVPPLGWREPKATVPEGTVSSVVTAYGASFHWNLPELPSGETQEAIVDFLEGQTGGKLGVAFSSRNGLVEYAELTMAAKSQQKLSWWQRLLRLST
jgi:hypothetical protein